LAALAASGCGPSYPRCDHDTDCHRGEFCVSGRCQQCRGDSDCPAGQGCNDGRCEARPGYCGSTNDCPNGQECQNHVCTQVTSSQNDLPQDDLNANPGPCGLDKVLFDFESADLPQATRDQLARAAQCIRDRHIAHVTIIGNCDPRGTEEYNLALGDRRARAIRDYLVSLGIERGVLSTTSHGEEFARGNDESTWGQDRNAELSAGQ
jgi:peptidoglycan-associated lipoprotein